MAEDRHDGGGVGPFSFTFPSIKQEHIKVSVNNSDPGSSAYFFNSYNSTTGGSIEFNSNTAQGTKNVRIYRKTDGDNLEHTFQVGSSIKASDLNDSNKQSLFLAEENRESINSLAAGDATGAIQISGSNIADDSITTSKILDLEVKSGDISSSSSNDSLRAITTDHIRDDAVTTDKLKSSTSTDSDRAVTTNHIRDGAVTDVKLSTISGTKISPNFGSQNIVTTGTLGSDDITITGSFPALHLTDDGDNPDYSIKNLNGTLAITDNTNSTVKLQVNSSDGHVDLPSHVDIGAGLDVTGNLNATGTCTATTFSGSGASLTNLPASALTGALPAIDGANLTNINTAARQFKEAVSNGQSNTNSGDYTTKVELQLTGLSSTSRVFVYYDLEISVSQAANNATCRARVSGPGFIPGDVGFETTSTNGSRHHGLRFCASTATSRTYKIEFLRLNSRTGEIRNARLYALEVRP